MSGINYLIKLAAELDAAGLVKRANYIDGMIKKLSEVEGDCATDVAEAIIHALAEVKEADPLYNEGAGDNTESVIIDQAEELMMCFKDREEELRAALLVASSEALAANDRDAAGILEAIANQLDYVMVPEEA